MLQKLLAQIESVSADALSYTQLALCHIVHFIVLNNLLLSLFDIGI